MKKNNKKKGVGVGKKVLPSGLLPWIQTSKARKVTGQVSVKHHVTLAYWFRDRGERRSTEKRRKWFRVKSYSR